MQESANVHTIEEQKTRLWALSFESTKQVVSCHKCGTPNVVNRLVQDQNAEPLRRESSDQAPQVVPDAPALEPELDLEIKKAANDLALRKELRRSKSAIFLLSTLSAGLSMALFFKVRKTYRL